VNFSYREIGLITSLVLILLIFGHYLFGFFVTIDASSEQQPGPLGLIKAVILVAILEAIIHALLAILCADQSPDERDQLIARMAYRNSYWFLIAGVVLVVLLLLVIDAGVWFESDYLAVFATAYGLAHILLLLFVMAEVINFVTQLFYYRKGI
jgi:hypothetical protein